MRFSQHTRLRKPIAKLWSHGNHLQANHSLGHTAHGGNPNFGARMWKVTHTSPSSITLNYLSPDGENGFPGNLNLFVTYTVTEDNALDIRYEATTDKPTVLNLCNHSFFNVSGNLNQSVENQTMWVDARLLQRIRPEQMRNR